MRKVRRLFLTVLIALVALVLLPKRSVLAQSGGLTETGGAGYIVNERKETNLLDYGIKQYTDIGETLRGGNYYSQQVNVLEIPSSSGVKIVSYANLDGHQWTRATVRNFARKYEQENPGWRVIAAINGDFFDINGYGNLRYQTNNPLVNDGEYYKTRTANFAIGFANDGSQNPIIAGKPTKTDYMRLAVYDEKDAIVAEFNIEKLNALPEAGQTAVYFGVYNTEKKYVPVAVPQEGYQAAFYVEDAELALPNNVDDFYGRGVITKTAVETVERGQFAILTNNDEVASALAVGKKIRAQYEFTGAFARAAAVTGHNSHFLKNGEYLSSSLDGPHPRTLVGVRENGTIVMTVVDGRQQDKGMHGVHVNEMAAIMKHYNCVDAYNLDGGGSSTMIIRDGDDFKVMNSPSDGFERSDSNCLLIVTRDPDIEYEITEVTENSLTVNAEIINPYTHRIEELLVRVGSVTRPVVNGSVTIEGLLSGTQYRVEFLYSAGGANYKIPNLEENVATLKRAPTFFGLEFSESATEYTFTVSFYDPEKTSDLATAALLVNGVEYRLAGGALTLNRADIGKITEVRLRYSVDRGGDHIEEIELLNPQFMSATILNEILKQLNESILDIYG